MSSNAKIGFIKGNSIYKCKNIPVIMNLFAKTKEEKLNEKLFLEYIRPMERALEAKDKQALARHKVNLSQELQKLVDFKDKNIIIPHINNLIELITKNQITLQTEQPDGEFEPHTFYARQDRRYALMEMQIDKICAISREKYKEAAEIRDDQCMYLSATKLE